MTERLVIVADEADSALAGLSGRFDWNDVSSSPPDPAAHEALVVGLGAGHSSGTGIIWLDGSSEAAGNGAASAGDHQSAASEPTAAGPPLRPRVIAQAGNGLWRRAPWPAADPLFDLDPPCTGASVLVAGGDGQRRDDLNRTLAEAGVPVVARERLTLADLQIAAVVILPSVPGAPLPARALAVLAAGRLLVTGRCLPAFGLQPGIDHIAAATNGEAAHMAGAALRFPRAFTSLRAFGRLAAAPHRASLVYRRLLVDIALEDAAIAPRRSPVPHG